MQYPLVFPHPLSASEEGILAIGADLEVDRLLLAYRYGIFPWYNPTDPIIWWYPMPRFVLFPDELKVPKSMRTYFNNDKYQVTLDKDFDTVIEHCQTIPRPGQRGTWLNDDLKEKFRDLHAMGHAHSVEVWDEDKLVGGLYGLAVGKIFSGESMFSLANNASKFAFISLVRFLKQRGFLVIDCQQKTRHLAMLGGKEISGEEYFGLIRSNIFNETIEGSWSAEMESQNA